MRATAAWRTGSRSGSWRERSRARWSRRSSTRAGRAGSAGGRCRRADPDERRRGSAAVQRPTGVIQEIWVLLCAYQAVRNLTAAPAAPARRDPLRTCFVNALGVVRGPVGTAAPFPPDITVAVFGCVAVLPLSVTPVSEVRLHGVTSFRLSLVTLSWRPAAGRCSGASGRRPGAACVVVTSAARRRAGRG